jgi:pimeloyl-ACP methyl ester carboxylesterase
MSSIADKFVFPAPQPTYTKDSCKKHLCWIPWNETISPKWAADEKFAEGIPCMWFPAPRAAAVMIFFHGNAEDLGMSFSFVRHMRDQFKVNVLAMEYPGYGLLSHVTASEAYLKEVALTVFRFVLDEMKVAYEQILLFGRSIGSGPAVYLASRFPVGGLILVAAFASVKEVIKSLVGKAVAWTFAERFPNLALIGNVSCPTLFIHGERDNLVKPEQSLALFKRCRARKLLINPPKMEHNTNLFTDATFLAVPAINFFGLPGYQQDRPPRMPARCFEDGRRAFQRRLQRAGRGPGAESSSNPWFFFCGCPTGRARGVETNGEPIDRIEQSERHNTGLPEDEIDFGDFGDFCEIGDDCPTETPRTAASTRDEPGGPAHFPRGLKGPPGAVAQERRENPALGGDSLGWIAAERDDASGCSTKASQSESDIPTLMK